MLSTIIVCLAAVLLIALLVFEKQAHTRRKLSAKTPLSLLFILIAVIHGFPGGTYFHYLVAGLVCCLAGDVCLALPQSRMFLLGLVAFLCGHVMYVLGFLSLTGINWWTVLGTVAAAPAGGWVYRWLKPHLGSMKVPVVLYIVLITAMVCTACGVAGDRRLMPDDRALVFWGAGCFYLSDIFVARQRFVTASFLNRLVGLPLYYLGQFMLAFSAGAVAVMPATG